MMVFILILLLLAAVLGVLSAVLKVAAILVLSIVLAVTVSAALVWWGLKRGARSLQRDLERRSVQTTPTFRHNEADPQGLPPERDDRY